MQGVSNKLCILTLLVTNIKLLHFKIRGRRKMHILKTVVKSKINEQKYRWRETILCDGRRVNKI